MVRAAIIGLGRWGRSLVNAVHGRTDEIKFVAAYTRTRASAERRHGADATAFCVIAQPLRMLTEAVRIAQAGPPRQQAGQQWMQDLITQLDEF